MINNKLMKQFTIHLATNPLKIETMYYNTKKKKTQNMSSFRDPGELTQLPGHFSRSYVTFSHIMSSTWGSIEFGK